MLFQWRLLACCALVVAVMPQSGWAETRSLYVGFWNLENLFDTEDDPRVELDEEFTPTAAKRWTTERLENKLTNLARVVREMNEQRGPDVLGVCEVENPQVLELLCAKLKGLPRDYKIIHHDSPSRRGIDCALIYDARVVKPTRDVVHRVGQIATRDILEGQFEFGGYGFTLFVNHWPSPRNPQPERNEAAQTLRKRIDQLLAADERADIVVIGDFNESPNGPAVGSTLRTWSDPESLHPKVLFNSTWPIFKDEKRGSYVYRNRWQMPDQVILSQGLLESKGLVWRPGSTREIRHEYQLYKPANEQALARPSRTYTGDNYHADGFSDHLPVVCELEAIP